MNRSATIIIAGIFAAGTAVLAVIFAFGQRGVNYETAEFTAPGFEPMTIRSARENFFQLTPALLLVVYDAFARAQEDEIYDTLASVTHGDALEYLYLQRLSAVAGGGLDDSDQMIHEIKLLTSRARRDGDALAIDAAWQVIGTVGHAEHLHVRGNTYRADLMVAPVDGAWKITDFTLLDVNRDSAGETFLAPQTN